jgi:hypothetical protein
MAESKPEQEVEKRIVKDIMIYRPIVVALKEAGYKARLDLEHSFSGRGGSVTIFFNPMSRNDRNGLVETLRGSGLYLDKNSDLAKSFPDYVRNGADKEELYSEKNVKGLVRAYSKPKQDGSFDARIDFGGIDLSFSPELDPKREGLTYESAQKLANAIRKQAGKKELPLEKAPDKMPSLAELEKAIPDLREPAKLAEPEQIVRTLNLQFGPNGYNFELKEGTIVSTREIDEKDKERFMNVLAAMPDNSQLPITARYLNHAAPKDKQKFRLTLDPKRVTQERLGELARMSAESVIELFEREKQTRPLDPPDLKKSSQLPLDVRNAACDAVAFNAVSTDSEHFSVRTPSDPKAPKHL